MTTHRKLFIAGSIVLAAIAGARAAGNVRIVDEADIQKDWKLATAVAAPYPSQVPDRSRDVCVNLGYLIGKDGKTAEFSVMRVWSSEHPEVEGSVDALAPFVQSAAAAVSMWTFAPTAEANANRSMYTSTAIVFVGDKGTPTGAVRDHCRIDDLRDFVAQARSKSGRRGDADRAKLERYQRENSHMDEVMRNNAQRAASTRGL